MDPLISLFGRLRTSYVARQSLLFSGMVAVGALLGALAQILLARRMTVSEFGDYAFAYSFLQFAALLFEFGLFVPAARIAARSIA